MDQHTGSPGDPYFECVVGKLVSPANTPRHLLLPQHIVRDLCAFLSPDDVDEILSWYVNIIKDAFLEYHYLEPMTKDFCQYRPLVDPWQWGPRCGARISETVYDIYSETRCEDHLCPCMKCDMDASTDFCHGCNKDCCTSPYHDGEAPEFRNRSCSCDSTN